jgi:hypothetical protein
VLPQETDIGQHSVTNLCVEVPVICDTRWNMHLSYIGNVNSENVSFGPPARVQRTSLLDDAFTQVPGLVLFSELPSICDFWRSIQHHGVGCGYEGSSVDPVTLTCIGMGSVLRFYTTAVGEHLFCPVYTRKQALRLLRFTRDGAVRVSADHGVLIVLGCSVVLCARLMFERRDSEALALWILQWIKQTYRQATRFRVTVVTS